MLVIGWDYNFMYCVDWIVVTRTYRTYRTYKSLALTGAMLALPTELSSLFESSLRAKAKSVKCEGNNNNDDNNNNNNMKNNK